MFNNDANISILSDVESMQSASASSGKVKLKVSNGVTTKRLSKLPDSLFSLIRLIAKAGLVNPDEKG